MSHSKTLVVELAKLAGVLAAAAGDRLLNAAIPSPQVRRATAYRRAMTNPNGQSAITCPCPVGGSCPSDCDRTQPGCTQIWGPAGDHADALECNRTLNAMTGLYDLVNGFVDTRTDSPIDGDEGSPGGVNDSAGAAREVPGASPFTAGSSNNLRGCGREPRNPGAPHVGLLRPGLSGRISDGRLHPSARTPHDEIAEPVGEYPDIDPRAVITGGRRPWQVGGWSIAEGDRIGVAMPDGTVRVGIFDGTVTNGVPGMRPDVTPDGPDPLSAGLAAAAAAYAPQSSAGSSPFPADTAPSPSEPAPPLVGSGHQTSRQGKQSAGVGDAGPGAGVAAPFTHGDLAEAARIIRCWADLTTTPSMPRRASFLALADRLDEDAHPDPNE